MHASTVAAFWSEYVAAFQLAAVVVLVVVLVVVVVA